MTISKTITLSVASLAGAILLAPEACGRHNFHREIVIAIQSVSPAVWLTLATLIVAGTMLALVRTRAAEPLAESAARP